MRICVQNNNNPYPGLSKGARAWFDKLTMREGTCPMCLAVPARVIDINGTSAKVDILGNQTTADISVLSDVRIGDYIMIHAGFGIQKYDEDEAQKTLELLAELAEKTGGL